MKTAAFISLFFIASVKFLFAPGVGLAKLNFMETFITQLCGGMFGILVFFYSANFFMEKARKKRIAKYEKLKAENKPLPKIFTKKNKGIIKFKQKVGYYGILFIAYPFVSLPIEGILCAKFYKHEKSVVPLLLVSNAAWSLLLTYLFFLFK